MIGTEDVFLDNSHAIRKWATRAPVQAPDLVKEMRFWLDYLGAEPSEAAEPLSLTDEALSVIGGDRQEAYGPAQESFQRIADLWSTLLGVEIAPETVGLMMILMKVSRQHGGSYKRDNFVDLVGYAVLTNQIAQPD